MAKTMIDQMVDRFLSWPLPKDFVPDGGVTFDRKVNAYVDGKVVERDRHDAGPTYWPIGTNLLTAVQAKAMIEHLLAGVLQSAKCATEEEGDAYMRGYFDGLHDKAVDK